jgi:CBS domain-containing protein
MTVKALRVSDFMSEQPLTVTPSTPIMDAVRLMVEKDVSAFVVVAADGALAGILTERDCIRIALQAGYFDETGGTVADFMTGETRSVAPDTSLMDVAELFADSKFRRCPVVADGRVVGLISRRDILRAMTEGAWFPAPT